MRRPLVARMLATTPGAAALACDGARMSPEEGGAATRLFFRRPLAPRRAGRG